MLFCHFPDYAILTVFYRDRRKTPHLGDYAGFWSLYNASILAYLLSKPTLWPNMRKINSLVRLYAANTWRHPKQGEGLSWLIFVRPCVFPPLTVHNAFWQVLFPCKGRADRCHTKNRAYSGTNFPAAFRRLCQSGYSTKFIAEFLGLGHY